MAARLIDIDVRQVTNLADRLSSLSADRLGQAGVDAVNEVAQHVEPTLRDSILSVINMSESYYRARTGVRLADNPLKPEATLYALAGSSGARRTPLGRYDPKQLVKAVKHPERSKGDSSRGIAAGSKGAGVSIEVVRGLRKSLPGAFTMPLNNGNGIGVFTRSLDGELVRHRLGPSVYQLFRVAIDRHMGEIESDLQLAVINEAERAVEELFT